METEIIFKTETKSVSESLGYMKAINDIIQYLKKKKEKQEVNLNIRDFIIELGISPKSLSYEMDL